MPAAVSSLLTDILAASQLNQLLFKKQLQQITSCLRCTRGVGGEQSVQT